MRRSWFAVCALSLGCAIGWAAGCSLPRSVAPTGDAGPLGGMDAFADGRDVGPSDAWTQPDVPGVDAYVEPVDAYTPPVDLGTDAYLPPVDAYVPPVDAYVPPDAWAGDASNPCDRAYGGVPGYTPCPGLGSSVGACTFYVNWTGSHSDSCNTACPSGRCIGAVGNQDGQTCRTDGNGPFPCDQTFQDAICTCMP